MKVFYGSKNFRPPKNPVITLGVFDGVHRGHRHIFQKIIERAREIGGTSIVYTFDPHPVKVLAPDACPSMINTFKQKIELIREIGIQNMIVERFNHTYAHQTPETFFKKVIVGRLGAKEIFVGHDFTFGIHRSGTIETLESLGLKAGVRVHLVEAYLFKETLVSSTQIRQLLARGNLQKAEELLARPYVIEGRVVRGRGIGERKLHIHTANLESENDRILPTGVYVTTTHVSGKQYESVTNIGPNPTFGPAPITIETHLLDFHKTIFGKRIRIEFLEKIREEMAFPSAESLAQQIQGDIKRAREIFRRRKGKRGS